MELNPTEDQKLVLRVRDEGVGLTSDFDLANTSTLGLQLVSGLAGQLGIQLAIETQQEAGAAFRVVFPVPNNILFWRDS